MTEASARRLGEDYLRRIGAVDMFQREPVFHAEVKLILEMLERLEVILEDEGLPPEQVERILRCVLYGTPSKTDAEMRMRAREEMVARLSLVPDALLIDRTQPGWRSRL